MTIIELSVDIHFINDLNNVFSTTRTENEIPELFEQVNHIWAPAQIKFTPTILPQENIINTQLVKLMDTYFTTSLVDGYDLIDVYFVSNVVYNEEIGNGMYNKQPFNGWTNRKLRRIFINDVLTVDFSKCVAHEIGHALGLDHTFEEKDLMGEFRNGINLSESEIKIARDTATF